MQNEELWPEKVIFNSVKENKKNITNMMKNKQLHCLSVEVIKDEALLFDCFTIWFIFRGK